ncbi:QacE family quaternary ammonium compound efflux SMR transporter [Paenibacillus sambharensis]|uniref:QacE family quaternary ammonium compound efflux SMR transporter n=2 Tax=Paenibacillus sambharensis TaxID=1803190 RepID=A0A2W1LNG5_9BACL|nr:QacE family quaternary ammonium compound efflux SMR transporter [Paenibacillus sambharensis]
MRGWLLLLVAIVLELSGTVALKYSDGFSRLLPSILMFVLYLLSFSALNLAVKTIDVSIAYAVWSGLGTLLISIVGFMWFQEHVTPFKVLSIAIIIIGVICLNLANSAASKPVEAGADSQEQQVLMK